MLGLQRKQTGPRFANDERNYPSEPHFNERKTLRSARRVVPLNDLPTKAGRSWRLVGALGAAILLGAGAALVIAYFQVHDSSRFASNQLQTTNSPQPTTSVAPAPTEPQPSVDSSVATENISEKVEAPATSKRPKKDPTRIELGSSEAKLHDNSMVVNETATGQTQPPNHTEQTIADRWEERRLRRIARRERRLQDREDGRGLFRIREIFEGVNRP